MKKEMKLGVIGGGFMAYAIVKGAISCGFIPASKILVSDVYEENLKKFTELGANTTTKNAEVVNNAEFVLFAVKPQVYPSVAEGLKGAEINKAISIMAGLNKDKIKALLPGIKNLCRVMPNLPCSIGYGMVAGDQTDFTEKEDKEFITALFSCLGSYINVTEDKMHAVTGISGSGPAYVFLFIKALIEAGKKSGLTEEEASVLAAQTVLGGVKMYEHEKNTVPLDSLIQRVCSKGGTTERAMASFAEDDMLGVVDRAVEACVKRSEELAK